MSGGLPDRRPVGRPAAGPPVRRLRRAARGGPSFAWPPGTVFEYSNLGLRDPRPCPDRRRRAASTATSSRALPAAARAWLRRVLRGGRGPGAATRPRLCAARRGLRARGERRATGRSRRWAACTRPSATSADGSSGSSTRSRRATTRRTATRCARSSRREMQQAQRMLRPWSPHAAPHEPAGGEAGGYGFGLFVDLDAGDGQVVGHCGGYPGFGRSMIWHPATGPRRHRRRQPALCAGAPDWPAGAACPRARRGRAATAARLIAGRRARSRTSPRRCSTAGTTGRRRGVRDEHGPRRAAPRPAGGGGAVDADLGPFRSDADRGRALRLPGAPPWWLRGERGWLAARDPRHARAAPAPPAPRG